MSQPDSQRQAELVARARRGDRDALDELLRSHAPSVYRFGLRLCGDEGRAEEVVQETFLTALQKIEGFEGRSSLSTWLYSVARSVCHRSRRRRAGEPEGFEELDERLAAGEPSPEEAAERGEDRQALTRALASLPEGQREAVVLRYVEGLSGEETAEVLGLSLAATKSRLHRGRLALARALALWPEEQGDLSGQCESMRALFSEQLESNPGPELCVAMEQHLEGCPACQVACDSLRGALTSCRQLPDEPIPPKIITEIKNQLAVGCRRSS